MSGIAAAERDILSNASAMIEVHQKGVACVTFYVSNSLLALFNHGTLAAQGVKPTIAVVLMKYCQMQWFAEPKHALTTNIGCTREACVPAVDA